VHGAFQGLCAASIFGLLMLRPSEARTRPERRGPALAAIAAMVAASLMLLSYDRQYSYGAGFFRHLNLPTRVSRVGQFLRDPSRIHRRHEWALARIRRADPLPALEPVQGGSRLRARVQSLLASVGLTARHDRPEAPDAA